MKIYEKIVIDIESGKILDEVSYDYNGPIFYLDSTATTTTTTVPPPGVINLISCSLDDDDTHLHDGFSTTILSSINPGGSTVPRGSAWDGTSLIIADFDVQEIRRFVGFSETQIDSIPYPIGVTDIKGLEWIDGDLWAVGYNNNRIYQFSGFSTTILQSISVPALPTGLTFDGTNLITCHSNTNQIHRYDGLTGSILTTISTPASNVAGVAWLGGNLYSSDTGAQRIYRHSGFSTSILGSINIESNAPEASGLSWQLGPPTTTTTTTTSTSTTSTATTTDPCVLVEDEFENAFIDPHWILRDERGGGFDEHTGVMHVTSGPDGCDATAVCQPTFIAQCENQDVEFDIWVKIFVPSFTGNFQEFGVLYRVYGQGDIYAKVGGLVDGGVLYTFALYSKTNDLDEQRVVIPLATSELWVRMRRKDFGGTIYHSFFYTLSNPTLSTDWTKFGDVELEFDEDSDCWVGLYASHPGVFVPPGPTTTSTTTITPPPVPTTTTTTTTTTSTTGAPATTTFPVAPTTTVPPQPCCDPFTLSGPTEVEPGDTWIGVLSPPCNDPLFYDNPVQNVYVTSDPDDLGLWGFVDAGGGAVVVPIPAGEDVYGTFDVYVEDGRPGCTAAAVQQDIKIMNCCDEDTVIAGPATVDDDSVWVGVIDPPCPNGACEVEVGGSLTQGEVSCGLNAEGDVATVSVAENACGTFRYKLIQPGELVLPGTCDPPAIYSSWIEITGTNWINQDILCTDPCDGVFPGCCLDHCPGGPWCSPGSGIEIFIDENFKYERQHKCCSGNASLGCWCLTGICGQSSICDQSSQCGSPYPVPPDAYCGHCIPCGVGPCFQCAIYRVTKWEADCP